MQNIFILLLVGTMLLVAGCEEQNMSMQKNRLVAQENRQLKQQLEQHKQQIHEQVELLEQCRDEQVKIQERADETVSHMVETVIVDLTATMAELEEQNAKLLKEIESLKSN